MKTAVFAIWIVEPSTLARCALSGPVLGPLNLLVVPLLNAVLVQPVPGRAPRPRRPQLRCLQGKVIKYSHAKMSKVRLRENSHKYSMILLNSL